MRLIMETPENQVLQSWVEGKVFSEVICVSSERVCLLKSLSFTSVEVDIIVGETKSFQKWSDYGLEEVLRKVSRSQMSICEDCVFEEDHPDFTCCLLGLEFSLKDPPPTLTYPGDRIATLRLYRTLCFSRRCYSVVAPWSWGWGWGSVALTTSQMRTGTRGGEVVCPEPPELGCGVVFMLILVPVKVTLVTCGTSVQTAQYKAKKVKIKLKTPCVRRQEMGDLFVKDFHGSHFYRDGEV